MNSDNALFLPLRSYQWLIWSERERRNKIIAGKPEAVRKAYRAMFRVKDWART